MIFVVVGTQKFQFDRLLSKLDELIDSGALSNNVFAQIGNSNYRPQFYRYVDFMQKQEFEQSIETCELLITHGGVSTIMQGIKYNKPIIVVPRRSEYGEHVDDHQVQIAETFAGKNLVLCCPQIQKLGACIEGAKIHRFDCYKSNRNEVIRVIRDYLQYIS